MYCVSLTILYTFSQPQNAQIVDIASFSTEETVDTMQRSAVQTVGAFDSI